MIENIMKLSFLNIYSESMQDLTAQVTSRLLQFPEVTIEALGEDEITLESVLRGKFAAGKVMLLKIYKFDGFVR